MNYSVSGNVALVTGANRGIGKAIVEAIVNHGAIKVYAAVRKMDSAASLVETYGQKVIPVEIDFSRPETVSTAANTASDVSLVVNNAGVLCTSTPFSDDVFESLQLEIETNVYGLIHMARAFSPVLKVNGGGAFVQLNSVASLRAFADLSTYSVSKAAAYSMTQSLSASLSQQGTMVLSVHPGPVATDMAATAGILDHAEPPMVVAEAIIASLKEGDFHCYPDKFAKEIGIAYQHFSKEVVEAN